jgi:transcriptional regulator with XRE-family HTH domain
MDNENRLGEFLRARRELARPEQVGLHDHLGRRRVPGLRREEVAMLAGVSADYYVRLEQGRDKRPSEQVIEALARVLGLDDDAVAHMRELARPAARRRAPRRPERVYPGLLRLIDSWPQTPAVVLGRYLDVLANNLIASALNPCSVKGQNQVRVVFLDPAARTTYLDWETVARETVASLRATAGTDLDDPRLTDLVGELSLKSEDFRRLWARHDVLARTNGTKRFIHPMVGELTLSYETFTVNGSTGQMLVAYHAEPGSASARALQLLGSLAAPDLDPEPAHTSATS